MAFSQIQLGKRLKAARHAKGYTQEQLAEIVGLSVPHLSRIECGRKTLTVLKLAEICDALDLPIEKLLSSTFTPENPAHNRQFVEIANGCSPEAVELMLDACRRIAAYDRELRGRLGKD